MVSLKRDAGGNSAFVGALVGLVFFVCVFGVRILDPTYIAWQLHDDPAHLYLGWEYFRHESWTISASQHSLRCGYRARLTQNPGAN